MNKKSSNQPPDSKTKKLSFFANLCFALVVVAILFVLREIRIDRSKFQIFVEKNVTILKFHGQTFLFGENGKMIVRAISPYFLSKKTIKIPPQNSTSSLHSKNFEIQTFFDNNQSNFSASRVIFRDKNPVIVFFFNDKNDEFSKLKTVSIRFESDFWILRGSKFPDFFPPPKIAILHSSFRPPTEKLRNFAEKYAVPLISSTQTDGFSINFEKNEWKLRVRK